jgi:hypothetical protein
VRASSKQVCVCEEGTEVDRDKDKRERDWPRSHGKLSRLSPREGKSTLRKREKRKGKFRIQDDSDTGMPSLKSRRVVLHTCALLLYV